MAIGRLSMKVGKAGKAGPHAAYIAREGKYSERLEHGEKLEATEAGNMPAWAQHSAQEFWQAADANERKNGTTYREMEIALPRELAPEQRAALVREFVRQEIGESHAYQWAIHTPRAVDGKEQPHVHLMFSERQRDGIERDPEQYFKRYNAKTPEKGGARKGYGPHAGQTLTAAQRTADLKELRGRWQDMANQHLERAGLAERIDMRSHAERGTGQEPEAKQLPSQWRGQGRANVIEFRQARRDQAQAADQVRQVVPNVSADIIQIEVERQRRAQARHEAAQQAAQQRQDDQDKAERDRPTVRAAGIDPRSAYHPDNIAKRAAQEAAPEKPAPLTTAERFELAKAEKQRLNAAKRPAEAERKPATAPPKLTLQEENALLLLGASAKKAQWDTSLKAERALYLGELTEQAYTKAVAGVALHQAHIDAKPMLFGREKWEEQRQGFENRDHANKLAWQQLKDGTYPFLSNDKEAVQEAVERRVSDKNPELARSIPKAVAALQEARERADALERGRQAQERAEKAKTQDLDKALSAFNVRALKREMKAFGHGDTGQQWNALPEPLRKAIEDYNRLPKEARPVVLERMRENMKRDPQAVEKLAQQLGQGKENDRGMGR